MRTLDDIIPPSRRREIEPLSEPGGKMPLSMSFNKPPKFPYTTLGVVALIIALSIGALIYFSTAKVEVTPTTSTAEVRTSLTATQSEGSLPFEIITAQKIATQAVKSSGTKAVSSSASGTVTIYNTQSKSQRLIANTRFATNTGLIFRIRSAVTVPGGTSDKPGSATARVYADQTGSLYNIALTSFTIPGFAGTPQATAVYARSSSPMTGGASGNVPIIDPAVEKQTRDALVTALTPDLLKSIQEKVTSEYVLIPGAFTTTYEELESSPSATTGQVEIKEQGTMTAVIFPNTALARAIANSLSASLVYQGEPIMLSSPSGLSLTSSNPIQTDMQTFTFNISGTASLVYKIDTERIAAAVSGKTRSAAEVALTSYPEIKRAVIILRPFWRQTFPADPASIKVVVDGL